MKVNLFIVGTPKAGTTSLHHYLNYLESMLMHYWVYFRCF